MVAEPRPASRPAKRLRGGGRFRRRGDVGVSRMIGVIETLEGRTLLSAAVTDAAPDAGYEAAQAQVERIHAAQSSAAVDRRALRDALKASRVAIRQILTD